MSESPDETLMQQIQQGDKKAFRHLVDQHIQPLYRFAQRALGNQSDAEDAVQDAFLNVWRNARHWQAGKASLSTWLHSITHNACMDQYRRQKLTTVDLDEAEAVKQPDTADGIHQVEVSEHVTHMLQQLPERQRHALLLCYYQGLSNQEAADILKINTRALESLLARARRTLRQSQCKQS